MLYKVFYSSFFSAIIFCVNGDGSEKLSEGVTCEEITLTNVRTIRDIFGQMRLMCGIHWKIDLEKGVLYTGFNNKKLFKIFLTSAPSSPQSVFGMIFSSSTSQSILQTLNMKYRLKRRNGVLGELESVNSAKGYAVILLSWDAILKYDFDDMYMGGKNEFTFELCMNCPVQKE